MKIRSCGPADLPVLLEIFYQSAHLACTGEYTPPSWMPGCRLNRIPPPGKTASAGKYF